jgi:hypothetical protein
MWTCKKKEVLQLLLIFNKKYYLIRCVKKNEVTLTDVVLLDKNTQKNKLKKVKSNFKSSSNNYKKKKKKNRS